MLDYLKENKIRCIAKKHSSFIYYPILLKTLKQEKVVKEKVEEESIEETDEEGRVDKVDGEKEDGQVEEVDGNELQMLEKFEVFVDCIFHKKYFFFFHLM